MVDEIQREAESQVQAITSAVTRVMEWMAQRETDPMKKKLNSEMAKYDSKDRVSMTFHPDIEDGMETFCKIHKIPYAICYPGSDRHITVPCLWIPREHANEIEAYAMKLEHNNPQYYRDSNATNYLSNLEQKGDRDVFRVEFATREEAEHFRDKLYQSRHGASCSMIKSSDKQYVLFLRNRDVVSPSGKMDFLSAMLEQSTNDISSIKKLTQMAQAKWDGEQENDFITAVMDSVTKDHKSCYLIDPMDKSRVLSYRPGTGILSRNADGKTEVLVKDKNLYAMANDPLSVQIASIKQACGSAFDQIHNMTAMTEKEYRTFVSKGGWKNLTEKELLDKQKKVLSECLKQSRTHTFDPDALIKTANGRPFMNWDMLNQNMMKQIQKVKDPDLRRLALCEDLKKKLIPTATLWIQRNYPNLKNLISAERLSIIQECLRSPEIDAVLQSYESLDPELAKDLKKNWSRWDGQMSATKIRDAEREARSFENRYAKEMEAEFLKETGRTKEATEDKTEEREGGERLG